MPVSLTRCSRITSIKNLTLACAVTLVTCRALAAPAAATAPPLLLQHPSMSATDIAFDYAGEIWTVPREGGLARRLVSGLGRVPRPVFSPDGSLIAYTGVYDGNSDVYVVSATGGEPTRRAPGCRRCHPHTRPSRGPLLTCSDSTLPAPA